MLLRSPPARWAGGAGAAERAPRHAARRRHGWAAKHQPPAPSQRQQLAAATGGRASAVHQREQAQQQQQQQQQLAQEPQQQPQQDKEQQQFDWLRQWYPIAPVCSLDAALPQHARLLGMDLCVWHDASAGQWRVFADRCPHRLAPLSEGIVVQRAAPDGNSSSTLLCNYHAWEFDGSGSCTRVPQLPLGQSLSEARACATSFPTRVAEGLLWVFPSPGPDAAAESAAPGVWPGLAPELDAELQGLRDRWYSRDLPATWLAAKENAFMDPSHEMALHHGTAPFFDRTKAGPISMRLSELTPVGYTVTAEPGSRLLRDVARFPCGNRRDGTNYVGVAYLVPTDVGRCRQIHVSYQVPSPDSSKAAAAALAARAPPPQLGSPLASAAARLLLTAAAWLGRDRSKRPIWLQHLGSHMLIDADIAMQSRVDTNRALGARAYCPAPCDAGPAAHVKWLQEWGGGGPPVAKLHAPFLGQAAAEPPRDRRQLLDRYGQHTRNCRACSAAHARVAAAERVAGLLAVVAAAAALAVGALAAGGWLVAAGPAAAAAAAAGRSPWPLALALGGVAALTALAQRSLAALAAQFVFVDYDGSHASKQ